MPRHFNLLIELICIFLQKGQNVEKWKKISYVLFFAQQNSFAMWWNKAFLINLNDELLNFETLLLVFPSILYFKISHTITDWNGALKLPLYFSSKIIWIIENNLYVYEISVIRFDPIRTKSQIRLNLYSRDRTDVGVKIRCQMI